MSSKLRFGTAQNLFDAFPAISGAISAEPSDMPSLEYLQALLESSTPEDAITFCAYLLPRREAVWWGHQCMSQAPQHLSDSDMHMLELAETWVREPEETRRNHVLNAAMEAPQKSPGVWLAFAAGWSGGSMVPEENARVPPPDHLTATAINAGILSLLARISTLRRAEVLKQFVQMGIDLTNA